MGEEGVKGEKRGWLSPPGCGLDRRLLGEKIETLRSITSRQQDAIQEHLQKQKDRRKDRPREAFKSIPPFLSLLMAPSAAARRHRPAVSFSKVSSESCRAGWDGRVQAVVCHGVMSERVEAREGTDGRVRDRYMMEGCHRARREAGSHRTLIDDGSPSPSCRGHLTNLFGALQVC